MSLVEVIKEGEIVRMSEQQARQEDLFILRRVVEPDTAQMNLEPGFVNKVAQTHAHMRSSQGNKFSEWKLGKPSYKRNNVVNELVINFQWEIAKQRRLKNVSRGQLASAIGASEEEIKSIELGELPRDDFVLVNKIEAYFGINLRKDAKIKEAINQKLRETPAEKKDAGDSGKVSGSDIEIID